ncbi:MAG: sulfurtransferase-like selenium metabolism protein YedF [Clostridia bacterium]|nr:sulfurtransferase-like selenium metabolism protein YedF [Clostridia bacterium]
MMRFIDAVGKPCPQPVIMAKRAYDDGERSFTLVVDNDAAVENLKRLGMNLGANVNVDKHEGVYNVSFAAEDAQERPMPLKRERAEALPGTVFFISGDRIGEGDRELGKQLMKMMLYTLANGDDVPGHLVFMNGGVLLAASDEEQVVASLAKLHERGVKLIVCGTCLDFYGMRGALSVGEVSNMYEIAEILLRARKVVTL